MYKGPCSLKAVIGDTEKGTKEKGESLWAEQTAQKVTPTQALCGTEEMEEKKEGRREDESKASPWEG